MTADGKRYPLCVYATGVPSVVSKRLACMWCPLGLPAGEEASACPCRRNAEPSSFDMVECAYGDTSGMRNVGVGAGTKDEGVAA